MQIIIKTFTQYNDDYLKKKTDAFFGGGYGILW